MSKHIKFSIVTNELFEVTKYRGVKIRKKKPDASYPEATISGSVDIQTFPRNSDKFQMKSGQNQIELTVFVIELEKQRTINYASQHTP